MGALGSPARRRLRTNAAGRGSGPHCPQAAGPRPRSRRFLFRRVMPDLDAQRCRAPARRLAGHAAALGQRRASCRCATARWTPAAIAHARIVARLRERGHSLDELREAARSGPARLRLPGGPVPAARAHAHARGGGRGDRPRARADRAHLERRRASRRTRSERIAEDDVQLLRYMAAVLVGGLPARRLPAARARLRPGARADRRRRGEAVPPVRARAADPRRRRRASRSPRRWRAWPRELLPLAAPIMDHVHQRCAAALHRAGRGRPPRARGRRRRRARPPARRRSPSPTSRATRG